MPYQIVIHDKDPRITVSESERKRGYWKVWFNGYSMHGRKTEKGAIALAKKILSQWEKEHKRVKMNPALSQGITKALPLLAPKIGPISHLQVQSKGPGKIQVKAHGTRGTAGFTVENPRSSRNSSEKLKWYVEVGYNRYIHSTKSAAMRTARSYAKSGSDAHVYHGQNFIQTVRARRH